MSQRPSLFIAPLLLSLLSHVAACGDSSPSDKNGGDAGTDGASEIDISTGDGDGDGDENGDGDGDDAGPVPGQDADAGYSMTDGGGDGDGPQPIRTATITLGEQSWTVVPNVRRGIGASVSTHHFMMAEAATGGDVALSCRPGGSVLEGGRTITISDSLQVYGAAYHCSGGGYTDAQAAVRSAARSACNGKSSCTIPAFQSFHGGLWGCQGTAPSSIRIEYTCNALPSVAPRLQFVHEGDVTVRLSALDGPGAASCAERGAVIEVPGYQIDQDAACTIELSTRTGSNLAGVVNMTLIDENEVRYPFSIDFHHERNALTSLSIATASSLCTSNAISHVTRVDGDEVVDILRAARPFQCEPAGLSEAEKPQTDVEIEVRRTNAQGLDRLASFACGQDGRVTIRMGGKSTDMGSCARTPLDEEPHALRAVFHSLYMCDDNADCSSLDGSILLVNYDFSNPGQ